MIFLIVITVIILLYILAIRGRVGFTDFNGFNGKALTHRGLHGKGIPENSLLAFRNAINNGYGSEFDVHITADGELVIIHDHSLLRTAGVDLKVEDLTLRELRKFSLEGTDEKIPTLSEVLKLYSGKYPLIIELKATKDNVYRLCKATAEELKNYKGLFCVESFDPRCVRWFKKNEPDFIRGQLSENYFNNKKSKLGFFVKFAMTMLLTNFLTLPDFVAYKFTERKSISFRICTKLLKLHGVVWTVKTKEDVKIALKENVVPIFEE